MNERYVPDHDVGEESYYQTKDRQCTSREGDDGERHHVVPVKCGRGSVDVLEK